MPIFATALRFEPATSKTIVLVTAFQAKQSGSLFIAQIYKRLPSARESLLFPPIDQTRSPILEMYRESPVNPKWQNWKMGQYEG